MATSNQISALRPIRPNAFRSPALAMPVTTTQKTSGAISALISLMKPSPSGWTAEPAPGHRAPTRMPATRAQATWTNSDLRRVRARRRASDGLACDMRKLPTYNSV